MSLKKIMQSAIVKTVVLSIALTSLIKENTYAQYGGGYAMAGAGYGGMGSMYGSGYWGAMQGCNYPWSRGRNAVSMSDEEEDVRDKIQDLQKTVATKKLDLKRAELDVTQSRRKLDKIFDSEVTEFVLDTHFSQENQCSVYNTNPADPKCATGGTSSSSGKPDSSQNSSNPKADCPSQVEVVEKLRLRWTTATANSPALCVSGKGNVNVDAMCADRSLKIERPLYKDQDCKKELVAIKKNMAKRDKLQGEVEDLENQVKDLALLIKDIREREKIEREFKARNTESDCPTCDEYSRGYTYRSTKRDWPEIAMNVGLGLALGYVGKKYDESAMEYQAQLGYPPTQGYPTAVSLGFPFIMNGVYGAVVGGSGSGGFGCAGGMNGGGFPWGAGGGMGGPFGGPMGAYGPLASMGGALGYPANMYGTPWGGGMYPGGYGPNGMFAGPHGGYPYGMIPGLAVNGMVNGGIGIPMSGGYPMYGNMGAMGAMGLMANGQIGIPMLGGYPMYGNMGAMGAMGLMANGQMGIPMSGGYPMYGNMGAMGAMGLMANGQIGIPMSGNMMGGMSMGTMLNNPQYQLQMLQMQQQMAQQQMQQAQQQMQMQMQYYQQQVQYQQQAYQRQVAVQQQAAQVQQEIASLQMRLQMLYSGAYTGSGLGGVNGVGGTLGVNIGIAAPSAGVGGGYYNSIGTQAPTFIPGQVTSPVYNYNGGTTGVTVPTTSGGR